MGLAILVMSSALKITKFIDKSADERQASSPRDRALLKDSPDELRILPNAFTFKSLKHAVSLLTKFLQRLQEKLRGEDLQARSGRREGTNAESRSGKTSSSYKRPTSG
jgi:hypothetical protein